MGGGKEDLYSPLVMEAEGKGAICKWTAAELEMRLGNWTERSWGTGEELVSLLASLARAAFGFLLEPGAGSWDKAFSGEKFGREDLCDPLEFQMGGYSSCSVAELRMMQREDWIWSRRGENLHLDYLLP